MLKAWHITRDLNLATALGTCGVTVIPLATLDEPTGRRITEFHLSGRGHLPAPVIPGTDPLQVRARFNLHTGPAVPWEMSAGLLRQRVEDGTLATADPAHPLLDVLAVLQARECLRTYMERGTRYRIEKIHGAPRARLVEGQEPMPHQVPTFRTEDLAMAASLARIGCPVLGITGPRGARSFMLPRHGHILHGRVLAEDAQEIAAAWTSGELARQCPEHPVVWGMMGCKNRLAILRHLESGQPGSHVLMRNKRSLAWQRHGRSALVEERSGNAVLDDVLKHLRG